MKGNDCFVVMPFDLKEGKLKNNKTISTVDFNYVYAQLISKSIEQAGLKSIRADEIVGGQPIPEKLFEALADYPICLIDATFLNANVYYELGIRHSLHRRVNITILAKEASIPFDVQHLSFYPYNLSDKGELLDLENDIKKLSQHIKNCLSDGKSHSPVYDNLHRLSITWRGSSRLNSGLTLQFKLKNSPRFILGIKTGNLKDINDIDAWVNSENDYMLMSRIIEGSISATIRYLGAKKDKNGAVSNDTIQLALDKIMKNEVGSSRVDLGRVLNTPPGELKTKGVKRIFHAATVKGTVLRGFEAGPDVGDYACNVISEVQKYNREKYCRSQKIKSLIMPVFGAGQGMRDPDVVTDLLVSGVLDEIKKISQNPKTFLSEVYFLAFTNREGNALRGSFNRLVQKGDLLGPDDPLSQSLDLAEKA